MNLDAALQSLGVFEARPTKIGSASRPSTGLAFGDETGVPLAELLAQLEEEHPDFSPLDLPGSPAVGLVLRTWDLDSRICLFCASEKAYIEPLGEALSTALGEWYVDARQNPSHVLVEEGQMAMLLSFKSDRVSVTRLSSGAGVDYARLRSLLARGEADPWFFELLTVAEQTLSFPRRAVSLGTLARLFMERPAPSIETILAGTRGLHAEVAAWARSMRPALMMSLQAYVQRLVRRLHIELELLNRLALDQAPTMPGLVGRWVERRDDLESALHVLRLVGREDEAREHAKTLDRQARACLTALSSQPGPVTTPRMRELRWQCPQAWWAELVGVD